MGILAATPRAASFPILSSQYQLSFRLQFLSFIDHFLLIDPVRRTFVGFGISPILFSGSSGIAVSSCSVLAVCPRFLISACGVFSFFVSYAYFGLHCLVFGFLVLFMRSQCMYLLYLHAAIPVGFFKVRVIISCCIFMSELLFGLCFR